MTTTQFQFTEPQPAILAACPRPRALAVFTTAIATTGFVAGAPAGAEWPRTTAGIAAAVRRPGSVVERPAAGYRAARVLTDSAHVELGGGSGAHGNAGSAMAGNGLNSSKQQDEQYLTTRREPVTWRPPH
ncbi:MAG TPA: hypothetical protein VH372_11570 [Actinospica sp.]|jgi:hypothetical protein|nr:hypothetical protein [Actinospica sp.]